MAEGIRASGGCEVTASTHHHVDALFGELHEMLWFEGTVVRPKENAGIHCLVDLNADVADSRSQVSLRCSRAKGGRELAVWGVTVNPESITSQAAKKFAPFY